MKTYCRVLIGFLIIMAPIADAERINTQVTINAGTPVRLAGISTPVNRLFIQSLHSNTGLVYVLLGVPTATTCDATNTAQLTAELGPGDATHPGQSFSDPQGANGNSPSDYENLQTSCIDGSHTGDKVIVSFWRRN